MGVVGTVAGVAGVAVVVVAVDVDVVAAAAVAGCDDESSDAGDSTRALLKRLAEADERGGQDSGVAELGPVAAAAGNAGELALGEAKPFVVTACGDAAAAAGAAEVEAEAESGQLVARAAGAELDAVDLDTCGSRTFHKTRSFGASSLPAAVPSFEH